MPRNRNPNARDRAREARRAPSVAEAVMWQILRNRNLGFKFRKEHPVGPYRLDFYCAEAYLSVEMDGEQHDAARDAVRDEYLASQGILTHRIPNARFFGLDGNPLQDEIAEIVRICELRTGRSRFDPPPRRPSSLIGEVRDRQESPLPSGGEGAGGEGQIHSG